MSKNQNPGCLSFILDLLNLTPRSKIDFSVYLKRETILSKNELAFFEILAKSINGKYLIFPKIRLQDIFTVRGGGQYQSHFNRISSKHIDFLLCDPTTLRPLCAIELDDRSHQSVKRRTRDDFINKLFQTTDLPLRRIPAKMKYTPEYVNMQLFSKPSEEKK